jgi:putative membrane protein
MKATHKVLMVALAMVPMAAFAADNPDEDFFKNAAQAGIAEVQAGNDAQAKATNPAVKEFAAMMVKDHTAANDKLKKIAQAKGVELPGKASVKERAMNKKTDMKSGTSFDSDYIKGQVKAHEDTITLLQKEIDSGKDPEAKAFASETLPKVKMHLAHAQELAASAG